MAGKRERKGRGERIVCRDWAGEWFPGVVDPLRGAREDCLSRLGTSDWGASGRA